MQPSFAALDDPGWSRLAAYIQQEWGLDYTGNLDVLGSKLCRRLHELKMTSWAYLDMLRRSDSEREILIECVTINETYFFREEQQLRVLRDTILPDLWNGGERQVRIWSSACSTGEEPYSLAAAVLEASGFSCTWPPSTDPTVTLGSNTHSAWILATDLNRKVLQTAERGWYRQQSLCFRRTSSDQLSRYFVQKGEGYQVRPELQNIIDFRPMNLLDPAMLAEVPRMDVIFCRNVMIYFDPSTIASLIDRFYTILKPGGVLFLGHAETIGASCSPWETVRADGTFYYRKPR